MVARPTASHPATTRDQMLQGPSEIFHHVGMRHAVLIHEKNSLRAGLQRPANTKILSGGDPHVFPLTEDFKRHTESSGSLGGNPTRATIVDNHNLVTLWSQCREHLCKACGIWLKGRNDGGDGQRSSHLQSPEGGE